MRGTGWVEVPGGGKMTKEEASRPWSGGSGCHCGVHACGHRLSPWCMCMMWSNLHGWKTLLSCCVNETCSVLNSHAKVSSLLSALPLIHHQCEAVVLLTCSALTLSPVRGEQLSCIQYGSSSNSRLILLHQNFNKNKFCGEKVMIWVSTKLKPGRRKARRVIDCVKWWDACLAYQQLLPCHHALAALNSE